ncbi:MAG: PadR family transcriptional regulator [Microthrixaceae bacterium]
MKHPSESDEWLDELVDTWTEMYKKSMVTLVLLRVIGSAGQASVDAIATTLKRTTGWSITERGLYRTLRRLASSGLLATAEVDVPRTGAKRKDFELTDLGSRYLARIERELLD